MTWGKPAPISPPVLLQRKLFCGHVVNWFVKLTQLKYQPSKTSADHFPRVGDHMVMVQRCLTQFKGGETQRRELEGKNTYLIPVVYTLKLFKIYCLYVLVLLKNKPNNP